MCRDSVLYAPETRFRSWRGCTSRTSWLSSVEWPVVFWTMHHAPIPVWLWTLHWTDVEDEMNNSDRCWRTLRTSIQTLGKACIGLAHSKIRASFFDGGAKSRISSKVWKSLNALFTIAMASISRIGSKVSKSIRFCNSELLGLSYSKTFSLNITPMSQIQPIPWVVLCLGKLFFQVKSNLWLPVQTPCDQHFNILPRTVSLTKSSVC